MEEAFQNGIPEGFGKDNSQKTSTTKETTHTNAKQEIINYMNILEEIEKQEGKLTELYNRRNKMYRSLIENLTTRKILSNLNNDVTKKELK